VALLLAGLKGVKQGEGVAVAPGLLMVRHLLGATADGTTPVHWTAEHSLVIHFPPPLVNPGSPRVATAAAAEPHTQTK